MGVLVVESPEVFQARFDEARGQGVVVAVFVGSVEPSTGVSWCGDTERADPFIKAALAKAGDRAILFCEVGPKEAWKGRPEHPYRTNPLTLVQGVPTVIRYQDGSEVARLVEAQLLGQALSDEIIAS